MKTFIKICGLTNLSDARFAAEQGADYLGFVLHPHSRRHVSVQTLAGIIRELPVETKKVVVSVNLSVHELNALIAFCHVDVVQLHGTEQPEFLGEIRGAEVWKAVTFHSSKDFAVCEKYRNFPLVLDSLSGGSGKVCNWDLAKLVARRRKVFLAGGLNPENIDGALQTVHPFGIDVGSGVEASPGRKDHGKIISLIQKIQQFDKENEYEYAF